MLNKKPNPKKLYGVRSTEYGVKFTPYSVRRTPYDSWNLFRVYLCIMCIIIPRLCMAEVVDRIVAVVDDDVVTLSDLKRVMSTSPGEGRPIAKENDEQTKKEALDKIIDDLVLKHSIEKAKITVDDDDLARAIANVVRQNRITPEQLKADIARKGISYETYKNQLSEHIRTIKFVNQVIGQQIKLTDRDLRDYYERNKVKFGGADFESAREQINDALYEEKTQEGLDVYIMQQRKKAYIDVRL